MRKDCAHRQFFNKMTCDAQTFVYRNAFFNLLKRARVGTRQHHMPLYTRPLCKIAFCRSLAAYPLTVAHIAPLPVSHYFLHIFSRLPVFHAANSCQCNYIFAHYSTVPLAYSPRVNAAGAAHLFSNASSVSSAWARLSTVKYSVAKSHGHLPKCSACHKGTGLYR